VKKKIPNILSFIRLILAPVFLFMYLQDETVWRALSIAVFAVAAATDFFDGFIARYYGTESDYGVFLDPLADKFLTFAGFICLPFVSPAQFPWWAVIVIMARDVIITGLRLFAGRKNITMNTRITAKIKTFSQMIFLYSMLILGVFLNSDSSYQDNIQSFFSTGIPGILMIAIVVITVYSGLEYLFVNRQLFSSGSHEAS